MNSARSEAIEHIRIMCPIDQVASEHLQLRRCGKRLVGRCPFHGSKSGGSFEVSPEFRNWRCWSGCGHGDVFDFVQRLLNCSFRQAVEYLASRAGIKLEGYRPSPELTAKLVAVKAQRDEQLAFERFYNERVEAVCQKLRALARAATHAEELLRAGESDSHVHEIAWAALERWISFESRVEREGLLDPEVIHTEWKGRRRAA